MVLCIGVEFFGHLCLTLDGCFVMNVCGMMVFTVGHVCLVVDGKSDCSGFDLQQYPKPIFNENRFGIFSFADKFAPALYF